MDVKLVSVSGHGIESILAAIRQCKNAGVVQFPTEITDNDLKLIKAVVDSGHESVIEFCDATFIIEGMSRACSHQFVRSRVGHSFAQQSQRHTQIKKDESWYVVPESITKSNHLERFLFHMDDVSDFYADMVNKNQDEPNDIIPEEDARFILPNACKTNIVYKGNFRALRNFFAERLCSKAQWEVRDMAMRMKGELVQEFGVKIVEDVFQFHPKCVKVGYCSEQKCCGLMPPKSKFFKKD